MKSRRQRAHPQGTNAHNRLVRRPAVAIAREAAPNLSRDARRRLSMVDWHRAHGGNVSLTARHYGVGRSTVYRWLGRYDRFHLETLEDRGSAPHRRRRPTWTMVQLRAVRELRERYPRSGQGQAPDPPPAGRDGALDLDGGADPPAGCCGPAISTSPADAG